jgi:hypothetical protein
MRPIETADYTVLRALINSGNHPLMFGVVCSYLNVMNVEMDDVVQGYLKEHFPVREGLIHQVRSSSQLFTESHVNFSVGNEKICPQHWRLFNSVEILVDSDMSFFTWEQNFQNMGGLENKVIHLKVRPSVLNPQNNILFKLLEGRKEKTNLVFHTPRFRNKRRKNDRYPLDHCRVVFTNCPTGQWLLRWAKRKEGFPVLFELSVETGYVQPEDFEELSKYPNFQFIASKQYKEEAYPEMSQIITYDKTLTEWLLENPL